jgi:hypothetical protein
MLESCVGERVVAEAVMRCLMVVDSWRAEKDWVVSIQIAAVDLPEY